MCHIGLELLARDEVSLGSHQNHTMDSDSASRERRWNAHAEHTHSLGGEKQRKKERERERERGEKEESERISVGCLRIDRQMGADHTGE